MGKVAAGALQPLGCLPEVTVLNNFQQCNEISNTAAKFHNMLSRQAVAKLNNESKDTGAFIVLDLFDAFTSVLNHTREHVNNEAQIAGNGKAENDGGDKGSDGGGAARNRPTTTILDVKPDATK
ncbi:hypothetical protein RHMOL_Rhmol03G0085800 [Rhododendron molle]|uniref:Uncharacterized protein n=1 Tax=Rhododendron molle TaxID=49168 RepID=A0ACC0PEE2_RHOML|nr:hypothetical protein RHMOL_Rhmol03G0085800 [Rhododendron molle]